MKMKESSLISPKKIPAIQKFNLNWIYKGWIWSLLVHLILALKKEVQSFLTWSIISLIG